MIRFIGLIFFLGALGACERIPENFKLSAPFEGSLTF